MWPKIHLTLSAHVHLQEPPEGYEYTILPLHPVMKNVVITISTRFGNGVPANETARLEEFEHHTYPFKELKIRTHVRPHFALFQAGEHINSNGVGTIFSALEDFPEIKKLIKTHDAWKQKIPGDYQKRPEFNPARVVTKMRIACISGSESDKDTQYGRLSPTEKHATETLSQGQNKR
jgi:hypothetical protein